MASRIVPIPHRPWLFRNIGWIAAAALVAGLSFLPATPVLGSPPPAHKVVICHATPPDTAKNGWNMIEVDVASVGYRHSGHQARHDADIIPPYTYDGFSFAGKNWTSEGEAIWNNDCQAVTPTATPTGTPPARSTPTPSPSEEPTGSIEPTEEPTGSVEPTEEPTGSVEPTGSTNPTPTGSVKAATGTPGTTLPPTDTMIAPTSTGGGTQLALVLVLATLALVSIVSLIVPHRVDRRAD